MSEAAFGDDDYRELLALRNELRRFLHWSEQEAKSAGLTEAQHQLLLAIRGHHEEPGPSIRDVADQLLLRHHSTVELVQRAELAGLVTRREDVDDRRLVRLALSDEGRDALDKLVALHAEERDRLATIGGGLARGIGDDGAGTPPTSRPSSTRDERAVSSTTARPRTAAAAPEPSTRMPARAPDPALDESHAPADGPAPAAPARPAAPPAAVASKEAAPAAAALPDSCVPIVCSVFDRPGADLGWRVLVDRQWPRGVRADDAPFDEWLSPIAPTNEIRRRFGDGSERFEEYAASYRAELGSSHSDEVDRLAKLAIEGPLALVTAAPVLDRSSASVLADEVAVRAGELAREFAQSD